LCFCPSAYRLTSITQRYQEQENGAPACSIPNFRGGNDMPRDIIAKAMINTSDFGLVFAQKTLQP